MLSGCLFLYSDRIMSVQIVTPFTRSFCQTEKTSDQHKVMQVTTKSTIAPYPVLLQSFGVQHTDFEAPHHRDAPQHNFISPKLLLEKFHEVGGITEWPSMGCSRVCHTISSSDSRPHVAHHLLMVSAIQWTTCLQKYLFG